MVITADQARNLNVRKDTPETLAIEKMIESVDKLVRTCSFHGQRSAHVTIPAWLMGVPVYDRSLVCNGVMEVFEGNGFCVTKCDSEGGMSFTLSWVRSNDEYIPPRREDCSPPPSSDFVGEVDEVQSHETNAGTMRLDF
jgi:hypothetical protein